MPTVHKFIRFILSGEILFPVLLIVAYIIFFFSLKGFLPSSEQIISLLERLYGKFGYEIIFAGAALEALVLVNLFVPGVLAVAFGAVFARTGELDLGWVIFAASLGAMVGYIVDYWLGYLGFGKAVEKFSDKKIVKQVRAKIKRSTVLTFSLGFFHPNVGSVLALIAGSLKINFLNFTFFSALATFCWITIWGLLFFIFGEVLLEVLTRYFFVIVLLVVCVWILSIFIPGGKKR